VSLENVDLFHRGLAAWNEGNLEAIVEMCHPDVEWTFSDRLPDATGNIRGRAAVRDFFATFTEDWSEIRMTAEQIFDAGDDVVADVRFVAKGREGIEVSMRFAHVWTAQNGQVVRFRGYPTVDEALEAVRLKPTGLP
jgi:ketosteroid isomerase-like protein